MKINKKWKILENKYKTYKLIVINLNYIIIENNYFWIIIKQVYNQIFIKEKELKNKKNKKLITQMK